MLPATKLLPQGFVYLREHAPLIVQSPRYATTHNLIGRPLNGYKKPTIIVTLPAADALKRVAETIKKDGFSLVIYDGYRPQSAVDHFELWAENDDYQTKCLYYPRLASKKELFTRHFIAQKSSHSRGSTVDATLIVSDQSIHDPQAQNTLLNDGTKLTILNDGTVDMGTSFDCMDAASHANSTLITAQQKMMRDYLAQQMKDKGFKPCLSEWWHFELAQEPFPDTYFNFPVE